MYLLSQLWLYLLLACLAGLALGLLLNRICQQRRHAAQLDALQAQHSDDRTRSDAVLVGLRGEHALALETAGADRTALQTRLAALDAEHHTARQGLSAEVESLQGRLGALQTTYESRITLLNTETSRAVQLTDELTALQVRHAALEAAHRSAQAQQTEVAKEAYDCLISTQAERDTARASAAEFEVTLSRERQAALADQETAWQAAELQAQALRDAQAAGQSAAQLREQAIQQELALSQTRTQELEAELRGLRLTLAENDEQLATLGARLQTERDQQQAAQARIAELAALVPPPAPEVPVVVRPAVSAAATITSAELERLVLAAGAGQQPAPVEIDHQRPDDLKIIDGIGPVNERWLHAHGVRYFWQIASWSPAELAWVANHLPNFGSRVYRENWIAQSAKLATRQSMR
ncbi:hypothetical protein [Sphaerotilus sp.]|uniref:hypothetical protein n=1 Tax=Sphaerotilus sp. TaxID=2093942 RepID=UPI00286D9E5E|nr:hypothetical protein [Sphaerotilus sp.]